MKPTAAGFALAVLATVLASGPLIGAPNRADVSERSSVTTEEKAVLPENKPLERNEVLMDQKVDKKLYERKGALVGERRSSIEMKESKDKQMFVAPENKHYEKVERKESVWQGKTASRFATGDNGYRSKSAIRFQDKIADASPVVDNVKPVVSQRTTFDKVNRFAFRRNADPVGVTAAGSGKAAATPLPGETPAGITLGAPKVTTSTGGSR